MMMMMMMMREYFFDNLRERRVQFQQCLNTCSRFLVLPVRDFLVNILNFRVHIVHNQDGDC